MKVTLIFGTRPEAIKMAPLVKSLKNEPCFNSELIITAQHREMLDQVLNFFEISPDFDFDLMKPNQSLCQISSKILNKLDGNFRVNKPDLVLVHGDTITSFSASLAAFLNKIPVAHIEAGLRTYDLMSPWPEEANRQLISKLTTLHFAPTEKNRQTLLNEGVRYDQIFVTGNTVIDALLFAREKIFNDPEVLHQVESELSAIGLDHNILENRFILITGHRRENFGTQFINICAAIKKIAITNPNTKIIYPVHLNPMVRGPVYSTLANLSNVFLVNPLNYVHFIYMMSKCYLILTDSGGIQEEAPSFGKPVLVMRENTERQEAVDAGVVKLVGTNSKKIVDEVQILLDQDSNYKAMSHSENPYGDGEATKRIVENLKNHAKNLTTN